MSGRGRPKSPNALSNAERQRLYKQRLLSSAHVQQFPLVTENKEDDLSVRAKQFISEHLPDWSSKTRFEKEFIISCLVMATFDESSVLTGLAYISSSMTSFSERVFVL